MVTGHWRIFFHMLIIKIHKKKDVQGVQENCAFSKNLLQLERTFYIEFPLPLVGKSGQPIAVDK